MYPSRVKVSLFYVFFFFQAEDGIRDLVRSRGLGDVYKRQLLTSDAPDDVRAGLELLDRTGAVGALPFARARLLSLIHI